MSKEFEDFLKNENIPVIMFKMLPKPLQADIEKKYYELKESEEN